MAPAETEKAAKQHASQVRDQQPDEQLELAWHNGEWLQTEKRKETV